jgi:hypothetical protein
MLSRNTTRSFPRVCSVKSVITTALPEAVVTSEFQPEATGAKSPLAAPAPLANLAVQVAPDLQERLEHQEHQETAVHQAPLVPREPLAPRPEVVAATVEVDLLEPQDLQAPQVSPDLPVDQVTTELQDKLVPLDLQDPLEMPAGLETLVHKVPQDSLELTPPEPLKVLPDPRDPLENVDRPVQLVPQELKVDPVREDHLESVDLQETLVLMVHKAALAVPARTVLVATTPSTAPAVAVVACAVKFASDTSVVEHFVNALLIASLYSRFS